MDNPAQGLVDTINQQVMTPAKQGMDWLQHLDPSMLQALLAKLGLGGAPPPPPPPMVPMAGRGRDIYLPPQGRMNPGLQRNAMLSQLKGQ